ncbi:PAS domain S-box protein [Methanogenium cariaci]|uniref:PAS domain-containing protein n=1 Tax=Methanogenium cariaci TaxID=2197 RepID=UPI001FE207BC|nr:PAS domain S-box protein [Methanogenium cariaci]
MEVGTFSELVALIHPHDHAVLRQVLEDYVAHKRAPLFCECRLRHRDTTWRWVRGRGVIVSEDPSGSGQRMIGTIMDINEQREAMEALAEREEQLRETQDIAQVGGWTYDITEDRYAFDCDNLHTVGFEGGMVVPTTSEEFLRDFVYQEDIAMVEEAYTRHLEEYVPFDIVLRVQLLGGRIRYLHSRCQTIFDNQGVPRKSVGGIVLDVTEIKEAENELLEREWKVNEAQRIARIRYWECDSQCMAATRTENMCTPLCWFTFLEQDGLQIDPDECDRLAAKFHESVDRQSEFSEEFQAVLEESGETLHLYCRGSHYYRTDGSHLRSLGTIIDITERVCTMNALRESETKFRLVAENPSIGTYIIQDGVFVYVNDTSSRFFGYSIKEMIGMEAVKVIAPDIRREMFLKFRECTTGERDEIHLEMQGGITQKGVIFPVEIFGSSGEYGGRPALIGTVINITKRKAYEEMLTITRLTVDQATIGIGWISRTGGDVIYINAQAVEMLRIPEETILGMNIMEIRPSLTPTRWQEFWDDIRVSQNHQFEIVQGRGGMIPFSRQMLWSIMCISVIWSLPAYLSLTSPGAGRWRVPSSSRLQIRRCSCRKCITG